MGTKISALFETQGHLLDSGLLTEAFDAIVAAGGDYEIHKLDVGASRDDESSVEIRVQAPDRSVYEQVCEDLMSLGFSEVGADPVQVAAVTQVGVAPEGFYSTTNLATRLRLGGSWVEVRNQRMDAVIVVDGNSASCVKIRDLQVGDRVVLRHAGIQLVPGASRSKRQGQFSSAESAVSSERKLAVQVEQVVDTWREERAAGRKVILVVGPVVVHLGTAPLLAKILLSGQVDGLLSGNATAVHDCEAAIFGTSLGVDLEAGRQVVHGHMHHMRAINQIRACGGLKAAVDGGVLTSGVMWAAVKAGVPFCLAGSIRDDGPLPDTEMDLIKAQQRYAEILEGAGLVVIMGSSLHGIGVGNMIPAKVKSVCIDIHPAAVAKLADRGAAHAQGIVTDVGAFLEHLAKQLGVT
ncbi:MAG: ornithine cyclodeaminase, nickel-pincer nucleotide-dependent [Planctomycetota bacterium]